MSSFFIFGIGLTFFLDLLLLTKSNKRPSDYILATWFTIIGLHLVAFYIYWSGWHLENPFLLGWDQPFPLLHGPLLLLYVFSLTQPDFRFKAKYLLHFVPAFLMYLALIPYYLGGEAGAFELIAQIQEMRLPWYYQPFMWMVQFSGLAYSIYCLWLLRKHKTEIENHFAYHGQIDLNWLRYLIWGLLGIGVIVAIGIGLEAYLNVEMIFKREILIFSSVVIWIFFAGYYGIRQKAIFSSVEQKVIPASIPSVSPPAPPQYQNSGLDPQEADQLLVRLHELMENEKPYLEPKLSLPQLAEMLDILPNHLSQLINEKEGRNFYQFVNHYRVEEFKRRVELPESKHLSLLGLAMECGFNSKSTFNSVFKQVVGVTPSGYVRGD
ncbi:MAG: helix-turn-helix domain-containing protein [Bacteroidetes bacterium]|nr:helix-turn-helix domain-containing protein [Bacteroidota bacterium]